jgi:hypothetical protein
VGFEATISALERAKTFHVLDRAAMLIGCDTIYTSKYLPIFWWNMLLSSVCYEDGGNGFLRSAGNIYQITRRRIHRREKLKPYTVVRKGTDKFLVFLISYFLFAAQKNFSWMG